MENVIFYFSGTGNCLKVAKTLSNELENGIIVSMAKLEPYVFTKQYDTIGIVYPTYFSGLPKSVRKFLSAISFDNNKNAYFYAITTYGGFVGNGLSQVKQLLLTGIITFGLKIYQAGIGIIMLILIVLDVGSVRKYVP
jgi:flavodoxin